VFVRGVIFGLNHALYSSLTGLGIALAQMSRNWAVRIAAPLLGLFTAIALHAIHNVAMFAGSIAGFLTGLTFGWGGVMLTIAIIVLSLYQERRWMRHYLVEEVGLGTLSAEELDIVSSAARRGHRRMGILLKEGVGPYRLAGRRYQKLSELAYRKRHHTHFQDDTSSRAIITLRQSISEL